MKKINTLTLNAYRHAVHILNPRHGRDKARHWGTLQTTERLPLARLAGEPRVRPDVCRHEHSPPFGAAEYRTVCKPAAVRPLSLLHLNALPHLPSSNFPTYFTFPWIAPSAPSSYTTHPTSTPCRGLWRRWERKRTAVEENSPVPRRLLTPRRGTPPLVTQPVWAPPLDVSVPHLLSAGSLIADSLPSHSTSHPSAFPTASLDCFRDYSSTLDQSCFKLEKYFLKF